MKTLKTKKVNLVLCWNSIKNIAPKDFRTIEEMEKTQELLTAIESEIKNFVDIIREGEEINEKFLTGEFSTADLDKLKKEWTDKSRKMESVDKDVMSEIELEDTIFQTFFQRFEAVGKLWFTDVREFLAFRKDMVETNSRPKVLES